jgi:nucleoid-associated protein YgaU
VRIAARERSEIRNLRAEAKRLRSDNAVLDSQVQALYKRVRMWSSATALVSGCAAALLLVAIISGGTSANAETVTLAPAPFDDVELATITTMVEGTDKALADAASMAVTSYKYGVELPAEPIEVTTTVAESTESAVTAAPIGLGTTHTVVSGDTLGSIALQHYGKSSRWRDIRDGNADVLNGGIKLSLGMSLNIPALTE